ncbi:hypothetical protein GTZ99_03875 [Novosphingobium sp. FSY-8]|uniref:Uncharacterized protein n=1 Tax=Novosphingobium ovatum TaxID=1908523 RepID=A0ABW9XAW8_9SPHN|nr:hypothetical protein [Novosphingobium ovatum]NBC35691.1 hypothetical protein [Novosphingobium ovatum]
MWFPQTYFALHHCAAAQKWETHTNASVGFAHNAALGARQMGKIKIPDTIAAQSFITRILTHLPEDIGMIRRRPQPRGARPITRADSMRDCLGAAAWVTHGACPFYQPDAARP